MNIVFVALTLAVAFKNSCTMSENSSNSISPLPSASYLKNSKSYGQLGRDSWQTWGKRWVYLNYNVAFVKRNKICRLATAWRIWEHIGQTKSMTFSGPVYQPLKLFSHLQLGAENISLSWQYSQVTPCENSTKTKMLRAPWQTFTKSHNVAACPMETTIWRNALYGSFPLPLGRGLIKSHPGGTRSTDAWNGRGHMVI